MDAYKTLSKILMVLISLAFGLYGCAVYSTARDERTLGTIVDDKTLESKIKYRLLKDEAVKGLDIAVYSYMGHIFLVGVSPLSPRVI